MSALLYNANGDQVVTASATRATTARTYVAVVRPTNDTARQQMIDWGGDGMAWYAHAAGDQFGAYANGTTFGDCNANAANFSTYALNNWLIIFGIHQEGVTPTLWVGNITTGAAPVEPSSYGFRTTLAGAAGGSGVITLGASSAASDRWWRGQIARLSTYPVALNDSERRCLQHGGVIGGALHDHWFGYNGTTNVPDYSGNGLHGTITSLTVDAGPPWAAPFPSLED